MTRSIVGWVLIVLGLGLCAWTVAVLGWRRMLWLTAEPPHPARSPLVFAGPYRRVRHPLFLALLLVSGGSALAAGERVLWLGFLLALLVLAICAQRETRQLERRFGEAYRRYRRAVPLLFPRGGARRRAASPQDEEPVHHGTEGTEKRWRH